MPDPTPRRPRFLAALPDAPRGAPARFAATPGAPAPAPAAFQAPQPPPAAPAFQAGAAAEPPPAPPRVAVADLAEARRDALLRVAGAVETLRAQAAHLGEQARADALEIGFVVARALLEAEVRQSPQAVFQLVRQAVRRAGESRRIAVRLSPEDAAAVGTDTGRVAIDAPATAQVELVADPTLGRGDCVVETDFGRVDGRLETRLAELRRAFDEAPAEESAA
jgi:flagellar biosynthesis/type III secretory pathway protein FliH